MHIGILGGGQLGRMLALAGYPLGFRFTVLDADADACAGMVAPQIHGDFTDHAALGELAAMVDAVTFDFENVPAQSADWLAERVHVLPDPGALRIAQDRVAEKRLFDTLGIPTPRHAEVDDAASLERAIDAVGLPAVLKTRRLGYDGKGQRVVNDMAEAVAALEDLGGGGLILEAFVGFDRELSLVAVRNQAGDVGCYPLVENTHRDGILRTTVAPAPPAPGDDAAVGYVTGLLGHLDYVGVLALELFQVDGGLLANEFAPRVHNSGHWTIEGAGTSQFENHLRAIAGLPLGGTRARGCAAMVNFIGRMPDAGEVLAVPGAHLHDYRKAPRPGRKLGHATVTAESHAALLPRLAQLVEIAA